MSLARNLWNAFFDASYGLVEVLIVEVYASLEGNDISDVESAETDPVQSVSSSTPQTSTEQVCTSDSEHPEVAASIEPQKSETMPHPQTTDTSVEEINTNDGAEVKSTDPTDLPISDDERQHHSSPALMEKPPQELSTFHVNQDLSGENRKLQAQIRDLEGENVRMSDENSRATREQENRFQEAENRLEEQKVAAEKAAAAAETRLEEQKAAAEKAAAAAETRLEEQKVAAEKAAAAAERKFRDAQAHFDEELLTVQVEVDTLLTRIRQKDSEIERLKDQAEEACEAKAIADVAKNELEDAKLEADGQVDRLQTENQTLKSQRDEAESKVSDAEGRARGLQGLLKATERSEEGWRTAYKNAQEDARDKVLSAYAVVMSEEENQQASMTASTEVGPTMAVELLQEKRETDHRNRQLTAKVEELNLALEEEKRSQKAREDDIRRQCNKEKEEALAKARDDTATSQQSTLEQDIRRECQLEMEKTLSDEREHIRGQWTSWASSLRGQFAVNLKARTNEEVKKYRRKASSQREMRSKVNKHQAKCVLRQAVSTAVEVERSLIQKQLRSQFQTELSNYKTKSEKEHAKAQTQSESQNGSNQEIHKRDQDIESWKAKTRQASDDLRQSEANNNHLREENQRLSQTVIAYESQESIARQNTSEPQIALTAQHSLQSSNLLSEIATMGLEKFHLDQLNELLSANKIIADLRSAIEENQYLDREAFQGRVERLMLRSNGFDALDPRERPSLHKQLEEAYRTVVCLSNMLESEPGEGVKMDLLEKIYGDCVKDKGKGKGKGKEKEERGAELGTGAASGPAFASNAAQIATSSAQADGINNPGLNNTHPYTPPNAHPSSSTATNPIATQSQTAPPPPANDDDISPATAHALQNVDPSEFDLDKLDWSDPAILGLDIDAALRNLS